MSSLQTSRHFKIVYCHLYSLHCFVLYFVADVIYGQSNEAPCTIHS